VASPFDQPLGTRAFREVWSRQVRWARLRRVTFPHFFAPEIGSGTVLPFAIAALCVPSVPVLIGVVAMAMLWYGAEYALAARAGWHRSPRLFLAFLLRDAILPIMWVSAWMQSAIVWRGNAMDIRPKETPRLRTRATAA
jgi:ceramide glucosyltransferase